MTPELQTILTVSIPTLAVLIGILINNSRLNDVNSRLNAMETRSESRFAETRAHFDKRIDNLQELWRAELRRVEDVLDARLSHLEERMG
jgi:hypothetical protein